MLLSWEDRPPDGFIAVVVVSVTGDGIDVGELPFFIDVKKLAKLLIDDLDGAERFNVTPSSSSSSSSSSPSSPSSSAEDGGDL